MALTEEQKVSNLAKFVSSLENYVGKDESDKLIELVGGQDKLKNASFSTTLNTGTAYNGSLVRVSLQIASYGIKINEILPEALRVKKNQIIKIALLCNIAKAVMFQENDNDWEVQKRGIIYKYTEECDNAALRKGERSALLAFRAGIELSDEEYEAITIMDKMELSDDNYSKYFSSTLSMVIRMATEMVTKIYKENR